MEKSPNLIMLPQSRADYWADRITAEWRRSVEGIINTGTLINEALQELDHGDKAALWERLPFSKQTGYRLVAVATDPRISKVSYRLLLPPAWRTLYELTKLDARRRWI